MAKKSGFRDDKAPKYLMLSIKDDQGRQVKEILMPAKEFSTGSVGYYASDKLVNPDNPDAQYQLGLSATLIGSKA
jgi:hypothetical protein